MTFEMGSDSGRYICRAAVFSILAALFLAACSPFPLRQPARSLQAGQSIERFVSGQESGFFSVHLKKGDYLHLLVEQKGAAIKLILSDPAGQVRHEVDCVDGQEGDEDLHFVADETGLHHVEVVAAANRSARYRLAVLALHPASREERARWLFFRGDLHRRLDGSAHCRQALEFYSQALEIWENTGDIPQQGKTLRRMGWTWARLKEVHTEIEIYKQALQKFVQAGDEALQIEVIEDIALAYGFLGELEDAFRYHDEALQRSRKAGHRIGEAQALLALSKLRRTWGDLESAIDRGEEATVIWRELGDRPQLARTLGEVGRTYSQLGRMQEARQKLEEALLLHRQEGDVRGQANALTELGWSSYLEGKLQQAIRHYKEALAVTREDGREGPAGTLDRLGSALREAGQLDEAQKAYQHALQLLVADSAIFRAHVLANLGELHVARGKPLEALRYCEQALSVFRDAHDVNALAHTLFIAAQADRQLDALEMARSRVQEVLELLGSVRYKARWQIFRDAVQTSNQPYYEFYLDLLMQMHAVSPRARFDLDALAISERIRAQSLEEALAASPPLTAAPELTHLLQRKRQILVQIEAKDRAIARMAESRQLDREIALLEAELNDFLLELEKIESQLRPTASRHPGSLAPEEIQDLLDEKTRLLHYAMGEERSFLWLVGPEQVRTFFLPPRTEIERLVRSLHHLFNTRKTPDAGFQRKLYLERLGQMLVGPLKEHLDRQRLLIVPDGVLQYVPYAALPFPQGSKVERRPLIERHEVVMLPSASVLRALRQRRQGTPPPKKEVAVFADPVFSLMDPRVRDHGSENSELPADTQDLLRSANEIGVQEFVRLPHSRKEGEAILDMAGTGRGFAAFGFRANRDTLLEMSLSRYGIIHFATHGVLHPHYPQLSGLVLSLVDERGRFQSGFVRAYDFARLRLNAALVVLSACRTAVGKEIPGEGVVGLPQSLMNAGVPRVVVSLWNVNDQAAAELMERFYTQMFAQQRDPAAALRIAQLSMSRTKHWQDPYYWAGFVFLGDWQGAWNGAH